MHQILFLREVIMKRRDFIAGAVAVGTLAIARTSSAGGYEEKSGTNLQRLKNKEAPSVLEQKHVPAIDAPGSVTAGAWFDVRVSVGFMLEHPSTTEHWITYIKLLADGREVASVEFPNGGVASPVALFKIRVEKDATLEAVEHCNIHGTWISEPVRVKAG